MVLSSGEHSGVFRNEHRTGLMALPPPNSSYGEWGSAGNYVRTSVEVDYRGHHYEPYYGQNCWTNQGAVSIDSAELLPAPRRPSEYACQRWCTDTPACDCVVYNPKEGQCWRRKDCIPSNFWNQTGSYKFTIYVKVVATPAPTPPSFRFWYVPYHGQNCWTNHGAIDIDTSEIDDAPRQPSEYDCQQWCTNTPACDCVVYHPERNRCWRRKSCNASNFGHQEGLTVYMKRSR